MQEYILKTVYHKKETVPLSSEEKERERVNTGIFQSCTLPPILFYVLVILKTYEHCADHA